MARHTQLEIDTAYHEAAHAVGHVVLDHELFSTSRVPPQPGKLGGTHGRVLPDALTAGSSNWGGRKFSSEEIDAIKDDITIILMGDMAEAELKGQGRIFDANNIATEDDKMIVGRMTSVWPTTPKPTPRSQSLPSALASSSRRIGTTSSGWRRSCSRRRR
jgi:hypothetical protein